jgi:hypothetical protein
MSQETVFSCPCDVAASTGYDTRRKGPYLPTGHDALAADVGDGTPHSVLGSWMALLQGAGEAEQTRRLWRRSKITGFDVVSHATHGERDNVAQVTFFRSSPHAYYRTPEPAPCPRLATEVPVGDVE